MTDYAKLKVTELKEILKQRGIPSTGLSRKQQIVNALEKWDAEQGAVADEVPANDEGALDAPGGEGAVSQEIDDAPAEGSKQVVEEVDSQEEQIEQHVPVEAAQAATVSGSHSGKGEGGEETHTDPTPPPADIPMESQLTDPPAANDEPLVLEHNQPVSKEPSALNTPQRRSPTAESVSSETRKRKRRSPTPPLSQESVNKKLKAAEEDDGPIVKLPEDREEEKEGIVENAPVAVERTAEGEDEGKTVAPLGSSDDVVDVEGSRDRLDGTEVEEKPAEEPMHTTTSMHPPTNAIYIRDLVRPLQPTQLRSHLVSLAMLPHTSPDDSIISTFHLDTLRTHAFAVFTSLAASTRVREALHGQVWPDEPSRRQLWVDYLPEEKCREFVKMEEESGMGKRDAKRWEVVYMDDNDDSNVKTVELREAPSGAAPPTGPGYMMRQQSMSNPVPGQGQGMPNAPVGPRGSIRPLPYHHQQQQPLPSHSPDTAAAAVPKPSTSSSASFNVLDTRFSSTTSKPKLYYLPVSADLVSKRLDAFAALTSQDEKNWDAKRDGSFGRAAATRGAQEESIRRYTFEDGDRIVDSGPDIGNFGREGMRRGDGGGGGSGGFRGRGRGGRR